MGQVERFVVLAATVRVGEDRVGLLQPGEFFRAPAGMVGVALFSQVAVSVPDLRLGGLAWNTENLVIVDLVRHCFLILTQGSVRGPARQREPYLLQAPRVFLRFGCLHQRLLSTPDLAQRPRRVSAHEWRRVSAQGLYERGDSLLQFQVPCGHAAVAQQACPSRARERGPPKAILELLVCPYLQNLLNLQVRSRPGLLGELRPAAPRCLRLVVGTDLL